MTRHGWRLGCLLLVACSDEVLAPSSTGAGGAGASGGAASSSRYDGTPTLRVAVPAQGEARVRLAPLALAAGDEPWDLAFGGLDIHTNSGPSGDGHGAAFGPLAVEDFFGAAWPALPFTTADRTGGAFLGWYAYEGAPVHALWSRYHVVLVRDGARLWKVQLLSYYGERDGAPTPALYRLRYAELTAGGAGPTQQVDLDGTAGGPGSPAEAPSGCLDLASGVQVFHTTEAARQQLDWHLCVRRDSVTVNGELGGPRGVVAVDLEAGAAEPLATIKARTEASERARFEAVTWASAGGVTMRGDRIVSAFDGAWLDGALRPVPATWVVQGADGQSRFLVAFSATEGPGEGSPGIVTLHARQVP